MTTTLMTGHCAFPATEKIIKGVVVPVGESHGHEKCAENGAGCTSPSVGFMPCPCGCHLGTEEYECSECGGPVREAPTWPNDYSQGVKGADPDEVVYVHIDPETGRALGEWC